MFVNPTVVLLLLIGTACAALGHVFWGRQWLDLPLFWGAGMAGVLLIYATNLHLPIPLPMPAGVPILETTLAAWIGIIVVARLRR
jgi:hypothetical protein